MRHVTALQGQPAADPHCSTSSWPAPANEHVLVPWAPVLTRPLQHLQVAFLRRRRARADRPDGHPFSRVATATPPGGLRDARVPARFRGHQSQAPTAESPGALQLPPLRTSSRPTGTRSHATIATLPGALPAPRTRTCSSPTGARSDATTAASPGVLPSRRARRTSTGSTGIRSHAPTATSPDALPSPPSRTSSRPTGTLSDAPTAALPDARAAPEHVRLSHGHPLRVST